MKQAHKNTLMLIFIIIIVVIIIIIIIITIIVYLCVFLGHPVGDPSASLLLTTERAFAKIGAWFQL